MYIDKSIQCVLFSTCFFQSFLIIDNCWIFEAETVNLSKKDNLLLMFSTSSTMPGVNNILCKPTARRYLVLAFV